jgi:hypothetical protein
MIGLVERKWEDPAECCGQIVYPVARDLRAAAGPSHDPASRSTERAYHLLRQVSWAIGSCLRVGVRAMLQEVLADPAGMCVEHLR